MCRNWSSVRQSSSSETENFGPAAEASADEDARPDFRFGTDASKSVPQRGQLRFPFSEEASTGTSC
jgi:hypothetical protein